MKELEAEFETLNRTVQELDKKRQKQNELIDAHDLDGVELERALTASTIMLLECQKNLKVLLFLDDRLSNLKELDQIATELTRLDARRKSSAELLQQLEVQWASARSKLSTALEFAVSAQRDLKDYRNPPQSREKILSEARRVEGRDSKRTLYAPDEQNKKKVAELAKECKDEADALRIDARRLWDRRGSVQDEILEIDVSMTIACQRRKILEDGRHKWDRDKQPESEK